MSMNGAVRGQESHRGSSIHRIPHSFSTTGHPAYLPRKRRTRLRVRPVMALLYMGAVALAVLLATGWELAAFILPFVVLAILAHRSPTDLFGVPRGGARW